MKTVITGARVFDGQAVREGLSVVIDGSLIGSDATGAEVLDGTGLTLLPGLIDAHVHLRGRENLDQARSWGVTTMLDMGTHPTSVVDSLRGQPGTTDIRSATAPASAPGGLPTTRMGYPLDTALAEPGEAVDWVSRRVADGADYIKVIIEDPAIAGETVLDAGRVRALVEAAHARSRRVIAHVTTLRTTQLALECGVDVITHVPLGAPVDPAVAGWVAASATVAIPTLVMMAAVAVARAGQPMVNYDNAARSVSAMHAARVPIFAGSDANSSPGAPAAVAHGEGLHEELRLLVDAGLSPVEALRAATSAPASYFGLTDRGEIAPGRRADLVLVDGDPTTDINHTRDLRGVWCGGIPVELPGR